MLFLDVFDGGERVDLNKFLATGLFNIVLGILTGNFY
jgi:hypothetical protein